MTTPRDPWDSAYGTGRSEPAPATRQATPGELSDHPLDYSRCNHDDPCNHDGHCNHCDRCRAAAGSVLQASPDPVQASGGGRAPLIMLVVSTVVVLLGGVIAVMLSRAESRPQSVLQSMPQSAPQSVPQSAPPPLAVPAAPRMAEGPPVPSHPTGTDTLANPTITTAKVPYQDSTQWCTLLIGADVHAATGFSQLGVPDSTWLCTHYFTDNAGYFFVSDIPASVGSAFTVRGNTAIIYQRDPTTCEVSVALNRSGGVLDIDVRGVQSPRVPICEAAVTLAGRALDRLPDA